MRGRIVVSFAGAGCGAGELSWGQQLVWSDIRRWKSSLTLGGVTTLPPGRTVDGLAKMLGLVMGRHQSLRTRLAVDSGGRARQVVAGSGEIALEVVDAGGDDPAEVAERVRDGFRRVPFDYAEEWPVRMAVILHRGVPTHLVAIYCHLALDGGGLDALVADVTARRLAAGRPAGPVRGLRPLEQARWERGPVGRRHNEVTLRYWDGLLRTIPARRFAEPGDVGPPRYREIRSGSVAVELATRTISARTGVATPAVLLAASAAALARVTGITPSVAMVVVSNRFRPELAHTVSAVSQPGLCVVDAADATFDEVLARAWRGSLAAYKNAYCDPLQRDALHARLARERGEEIDLSCFFNDHRSPARIRVSGGPAPTGPEISAALPLTWVRWLDQPTHPVSRRFYVHVNDVPETVELRLNIDSRYVSPADAEAYLRELQTIAVEAALDPAASATRVVVPHG